MPGRLGAPGGSAVARGVDRAAVPHGPCVLGRGRHRRDRPHVRRSLHDAVAAVPSTQHEGGDDGERHDGERRAPTGGCCAVAAAVTCGRVSMRPPGERRAPDSASCRGDSSGVGHGWRSGAAAESLCRAPGAVLPTSHTTARRPPVAPAAAMLVPRHKEGTMSTRRSARSAWGRAALLLTSAAGPGRGSRRPSGLALEPPRQGELSRLQRAGQAGRVARLRQGARQPQDVPGSARERAQERRPRRARPHARRRLRRPGEACRRPARQGAGAPHRVRRLPAQQ